MQFQTLDVISINIWHIVISLCNLLILFFFLKKFLYKPVKEVLKKRQDELDGQYEAAAEAQAQADANKQEWEQTMKEATVKADAIIKEAADTAKLRGEKIVATAQERADDIVAEAQAQAELERKNAEAGIRREIVVVSTEIAQKMLEREINEDDHRQLIGSFLDRMGDADD